MPNLLGQLKVIPLVFSFAISPIAAVAVSALSSNACACLTFGFVLVFIGDFNARVGSTEEKLTFHEETSGNGENKIYSRIRSRNMQHLISKAKFKAMESSITKRRQIPARLYFDTENAETASKMPGHTQILLALD